MAKKTTSETAGFKRRIFGYRRADVDQRVAELQAESTRRTEQLEFEVGRLTDELAVATHADDDLALRATRRAVESILSNAHAQVGDQTDTDVVIDLRDPIPSSLDGESVPS